MAKQKDFQNCMYFYRAKNVLLPMGEKEIDEKQIKDEYCVIDDFIYVLGELSCGVTLCLVAF